MTLAERRQREKDQRRESIINAAGRLFFKKGYERVTMNDIASEAELSKATLYTYFKDKDSIYFAIVNHGTKILTSLIKEEEERLQHASVSLEQSRLHANGLSSNTLTTLELAFIFGQEHLSYRVP